MPTRASPPTQQELANQNSTSFGLYEFLYLMVKSHRLTSPLSAGLPELKAEAKTKKRDGVARRGGDIDRADSIAHATIHARDGYPSSPNQKRAGWSRGIGSARKDQAYPNHPREGRSGLSTGGSRRSSLNPAAAPAKEGSEAVQAAGEAAVAAGGLPAAQMADALMHMSDEEQAAGNLTLTLTGLRPSFIAQFDGILRQTGFRRNAGQLTSPCRSVIFV